MIVSKNGKWIGPVVVGVIAAAVGFWLANSKPIGANEPTAWVDAGFSEHVTITVLAVEAIAGEQEDVVTVSWPNPSEPMTILAPKSEGLKVGERVRVMKLNHPTDVMDENGRHKDPNFRARRY